MLINKGLKQTVFLLLTSISTLTACKSDGNVTSPSSNEPDQSIDWNAAADSSSNALIYNYWNPQEKYFNYGNQGNSQFHYWPQAHALDVLTDAYLRTNKPIYEQYIQEWYEGVKQKNGDSFLNIFYDDMEWNALAMLRAYNVTDDEKFKIAVDNIWDDIKTGWTEVAGGGIMWKKDTPFSKNACSNAPASILAARLYQSDNDADDLEWAKKIYNWQKNKLVDPASGTVWDGLAVDNGAESVNKDWKFTYNQGTFIGAALELYEITGEMVYLNDAVKTADFTLSSLSSPSDRLLKDEGTGDGGLFKGIFIRYFTQLILVPELSESVKNRYITFLKHNAETLWLEGTDKNHVLFGPYWKDKPTGEVDLTVQLSGAMLIEAAALLENEGLFSE